MQRNSVDESNYSIRVSTYMSCLHIFLDQANYILNAMHFYYIDFAVNLTQVGGSCVDRGLFLHYKQQILPKETYLMLKTIDNHFQDLSSRTLLVLFKAVFT